MNLEYILHAHGLVGRGGKKVDLPEIINFTGTSGDEGTKITLNWVNPTIMEFTKTQIFVSDTDIANVDYATLSLNGTKIVDANIESFTLEGLTHNDVKYFKAFTIINTLGETKASRGINLTVTAKDIQAPGVVTGVTIKEDNTKLDITLTNPTDADFLKTIVRYGTALIADENSGTLGYEGSAEAFSITGLTNDTEYYIRIFTVDTAGNVNRSTNMQYTAIPSDIDPNTWNGVQRIVRQGLANELFNVGDQLASNYDGREIIWEVIGIDVDTPTDSQFQHSMTIQTRDCLLDAQFDAPEPNNPDANRKSYGNNRYIYSNLKQWLNSNDSVFNWVSQHAYDVKSTGVPYDGPGFLNKLDPELTAVLGAVDKKVAKASVDGGGQESFTDKVFLLSPKELGYTPAEMNNDGDYTGEVVYPFYNGVANAQRIKNLNASPRHWWLRSPRVSHSSNDRYVSTSGAIVSNNASSSFGVSPACVII